MPSGTGRGRVWPRRQRRRPPAHTDDPGVLQRLASHPSVFVVAAGAWLMVAPFAVDDEYSGWSDVVTGAVMVVVGIVRILAPARTAALSLINVALGGWLIAAPFALGYSAVPAATWNDVIVGMVVIFLAGVSWFAVRDNSVLSDDDSRP